MPKSRRALAGLALLNLLLVILFFAPLTNWVWDPAFYYAQVRSPIVDGDVDFRNDVDGAVPPAIRDHRSSTGLLNSIWPVGPSLLWSPFFLLAHGAKLLLGDSGVAAGNSPLYLGMVAAGSALYGLLGLLLLYQLCRQFAERGLALLTVLLTLMATPLFYYVYRMPFMAHSTTFLTSTLVILLCYLIHQGRIELRYSGLLLGVALGLHGIQRWSAGLLAIIPATLLAELLVQAYRQRDRAQLVALLKQVLVAAAVGLLVASPQLAMWYRLRGSWISQPVPSGFGEALPIYAPNLFFHTNRGLLYWSPFMLAGVLGALRLRPLFLRVGGLLYLGALIYMLGRWITWAGGGGFGPRYLLEALPVMALGFLFLLRDIWHYRAVRTGLALVAALLLLHQQMLVLSVEQLWLPMPAYNQGSEELGVSFQLEHTQRILRDPGVVFAPRPLAEPGNHALITSLLSGSPARDALIMPLIGCLVLSLGLLCYGRLARLGYLRPLALLACVYMLSWFGLYLLV